jgi:glucosyl-3-phosphoglycerate synthase
MNGLYYDYHLEEKTVEMFASNIMRAGEIFFENPMDTPFSPTWSRVNSAIPDFLLRFRDTIEEDNRKYGKK